MKSILYVGMDVHKLSYTLCCYSIEKDETFAIVQMEPKVTNITTYLDQIKRNYGDCEFLCGYEAGSLGYSLHHQLFARGIDCVILAPTTMADTNNRRIKTDKNMEFWSTRRYSTSAGIWQGNYLRCGGYRLSPTPMIYGKRRRW